MTTSLAKVFAAAVVLLGVGMPPAYADDLEPPPGPSAQNGPTADPFLDDLVNMVSEGSQLAPSPSG